MGLPTSKRPHDTSTLPKWAQQQINTLRGELAVAERNLALVYGSMADDRKVMGNPVVDPYGHAMPLYDDFVRYWGEETDAETLDIKPGVIGWNKDSLHNGLRVSAIHGAIHVLPEASNSIRVYASSW